MSRRDAILRAAAGGLQADKFDWSQFRRRGTREERQIRAKPMDIAGALAFQGLDQFEGQDGKPAPANDPSAERLPGEPLMPLLLRLKYASQLSKDSFERAHLLLLKRYDSLGPAKAPKAVFAVAAVALFEWVHDRCPKCRLPRARQVNPRPCLSCGQRKDESTGVIFGQPSAGCPSCKGLGRIFDKPKERTTGMRCVSCRNSGRVEFKLQQRWRLVNEYANELGVSVSLEAFRSHWATRYHHFVDVLRSADRRIVADLALGQERAYKRAIGLQPRAGDEADTVMAEAGSATAPDEPAGAAGQVPPEET